MCVTYSYRCTRCSKCHIYNFFFLNISRSLFISDKNILTPSFVSTYIISVVLCSRYIYTSLHNRGKVTLILVTYSVKRFFFLQYIGWVWSVEVRIVIDEKGVCIKSRNLRLSLKNKTVYIEEFIVFYFHVFKSGCVSKRRRIIINMGFLRYHPDCSGYVLGEAEILDEFIVLRFYHNCRFYHIVVFGITKFF